MNTGEGKEEDYTFKVYRPGKHPKKQKDFFKETFYTRQSARNYCHNRRWIRGLTIVHPNGYEEVYDPSNPYKHY